jgi:hypothetical protein
MPLGGLEEGEGKLRKNTNFELDRGASQALGDRAGGEGRTHHLGRDPEIKKIGRIGGRETGSWIAAGAGRRRRLREEIVGAEP